MWNVPPTRNTVGFILASTSRSYAAGGCLGAVIVTSPPTSTPSVRASTSPMTIRGGSFLPSESIVPLLMFRPTVSTRPTRAGSTALSAKLTGVLLVFDEISSSLKMNGSAATTPGVRSTTVNTSRYSANVAWLLSTMTCALTPLTLSRSTFGGSLAHFGTGSAEPAEPAEPLGLSHGSLAGFVVVLGSCFGCLVLHAAITTTAKYARDRMAPLVPQVLRRRSTA